VIIILLVSLLVPYAITDVPVVEGATLSQLLANNVLGLGPSSWNKRIGLYLDADDWGSVEITSVDFKLQKVGSPTGTLYVRLRRVSDDEIIATLGTKDVSTISSSATFYTFNSVSGYNYGVDCYLAAEYTGGTAGVHYVGVSDYGSDAEASVDEATYVSSWNINDARDITFQNLTYGDGVPVAYEPTDRSWTTATLNGLIGGTVDQYGFVWGENSIILDASSDQTDTDNSRGIYGSVTNRFAEKMTFPVCTIDSVDFKLAKVGSPTGTAYAKVWDDDDNVLGTLGSIDVSTLTGTLTFHTFNSASATISTAGTICYVGMIYESGDGSNLLAYATQESQAIIWGVGCIYNDTSDIWLDYPFGYPGQATNPAMDITFQNLDITFDDETEPGDIGYDHNYTSSVSSYSGAKTQGMTGMEDSKAYYYRFGQVASGDSWQWSEEGIYLHGVFVDNINWLAHDIVSDGTYLYFALRDSVSPGNGMVYKVNPETMQSVDSWTSPNLYTCQGLTYYDGYLYVSLWAAAVVVKLYKIDVATMGDTTEISFTWDAGDYQGYFPSNDGTYIYQPNLDSVGNPAVKQIKISDMTQNDEWVNTENAWSAATLYYDGYLYLGGYDLGTSEPKVYKIDVSDMSVDDSWTASGYDSVYVLRLITDGVYIYGGCGGGSGDSDVFKIDIATMTEQAHWDSTDTSIPDGSGIWGLQFNSDGDILAVACSEPTEIALLTPSLGMINEVILDKRYIGGDCLYIDENDRVYIGMDQTDFAYFTRLTMAAFYDVKPMFGPIFFLPFGVM